MSKKSSEKLSDAEALEKIARYEKNEIIFLKVCVYSFIIGIPALIIGMIVESGVVAGIGSVLFVGGFVCVYLKGKMRSNAESLVTNQLQDFYNTELQRAFGPCQHNKDMDINKTLIKKLRPVAESWNECNEWRFYEGCYQETRFSVENVELSEVTKDGDGGDNRSPRFTGAVLRCKDVCDPALDIVLRGHGTDHRQSDLMDPAVFRQHFSVCTAGDQPADDLVTPQLRELVLKLETLDNCEMVDLEVQQIRKRLQGAAILERKHKKLGAGLVDSVYEDIRKMEARANYTPLTSLILRNGEATLAIDGYAFAEGLPSGGQNLQNPALIRKRFTASLPPVCEMIDILRDSAGKYSLLTRRD